MFLGNKNLNAISNKKTIINNFKIDKLPIKLIESKKVKNYNNIKNLENYLKNYCANDCKYFVIKKI